MQSLKFSFAFSTFFLLFFSGEMHYFCQSVLVIVLLQQEKEVQSIGWKKTTKTPMKNVLNTSWKRCEKLTRMCYYVLRTFWILNQNVLLGFQHFKKTLRKREKILWKTFSRPSWNVVKTSMNIAYRTRAFFRVLL